MYGDITEYSDAETRSFIERHTIDRLVGRLRSGQDVVVVDANIGTWFPERNNGIGRYATVGLGVGGVPGDRYGHVRFQVTGSELFFGVAPLSGVFWPKSLTSAKKPFSAQFNPDSRVVWRNDHLGITADCGYETRMGAPQPFHFEVAFAPTIDLDADRALTVDEWVTEWVMPMIELTSLATGERQRLAWLEVKTARSSDEAGVVFGVGIDQSPFQGARPAFGPESPRRPLFTLANSPIGLPDLLRSWRRLETSQNPFFELCRLTLGRDGVPVRASFLYLVQALEALHSFENRKNDKRSQKGFEERRQALLEEFERDGIPATSITYLRRNWSKKKPDNLEHRLASLIRALPQAVRKTLVRPDMAAIASELRDAEGASTLEAQLRVLRNRLSHGSRNYADHELRPWAHSVEIMCRAHLLKRLGFSQTAIKKGLASPK